jgi:hypothetical protein
VLAPLGFPEGMGFLPIVAAVVVPIAEGGTGNGAGIDYCVGRKIPAWLDSLAGILRAKAIPLGCSGKLTIGDGANRQ